MWRTRIVLAMVAVALLGGQAVDAARPRLPRLVGSIEVSEAAGLGRIEIHGDRAAVLQRDEGIVALLDIADPKKPRILGRYDDDAQDSFDGDLAFSADGNWLFYARQTHQFSKDGIHVLDVSDPSAPQLTDYQPQGGTLRIAYLKGAGGEWVFSLDAVHGLVINRFVPEAGVLVPVHVNALPALKVGGPASAGLYVRRNDPFLKVPLLYVSTGETGVEVFDISDPVNPALLGAWDGVGLAEIEVAPNNRARWIYGATEYWFDKTLEPEVVVLDATDLSNIKKAWTHSVGCPADDAWRVQGMALKGNDLFVAHSHRGLVTMGTGADETPLPTATAERNEAAAVVGDAPYIFDVELHGGLLYATDAANGFLSILKPRPTVRFSFDGPPKTRHCG